MNPNHSGNGNFIQRHIKSVGIATIGVLALGGGFAAYEHFHNASDPTAQDGGQPGRAGNQDELKNLLTVTTTDPNVACVALVEQAGGKTLQPQDKDGHNVGGKTYHFNIGAKQPVTGFGAMSGDGTRVWSDSLEAPFKTDKTDSKGLLKELQTTICEDPLLGATLANEFAHMDVDGVKVIDLNEWMKPYGGDASEINDKAAEFMPLLDKDASQVQPDELANAVDKNHKYQELALKLNTLLERFQNNGDQTGMTTLNFHLTGGGLVVGDGKLPEVALNMVQYNGEYVGFEITEKPNKCVKILGFNLFDKRPEEFACAAPEETTEETPPTEVTVTTTPGGSTTTTHGSTTTVTFGPKVNQPTPGPGTPGTTQPAPAGNPGGSPTTETTAPPTTETTVKVTVPSTTPPTVTVPPRG